MWPAVVGTSDEKGWLALLPLLVLVAGAREEGTTVDEHLAWEERESWLLVELAMRVRALTERGREKAAAGNCSC